MKSLQTTLTTSFAGSLYFLPLSLSFNLSFNPSLSFSLPPIFAQFRREGHQASGDPVPQEESKRPPPSYCFFITYYLCLTALLQTNGCHMEKERQRRRKEGRKKKLSLCPLSLSLSPALRVSLRGFWNFDQFFWRCFVGRVNISLRTASRLVPQERYVWAACCLIELMETSILSHCKEMYSFCGL